jgi:hypothetical protein
MQRFFLVIVLCLVGAILYGAYCVRVGYFDTRRHGGVDLRNRVTAARVLLAHGNPYTYHWKAGDPLTWLDPCDVETNWGVSRVTVPPSVLLVQGVWARLSYRRQQMLWFAMQWALMLFGAWCAARCLTTPLQRSLFWILMLLGIAGSHFWRLHVERGQIYIVYATLIIVSYACARLQQSRWQFLGGVLLGVTAVLRPPALVMVLPLLIARQWQIAAGWLTGLLLFGTLTIGLVGISPWKQYAVAMQSHRQIFCGELAGYPGDLSQIPTSVEGMTNLRRRLTIPGLLTKTSFGEQWKWFTQQRIPAWVHSGVLVGLLVLWGGVLFWLGRGTWPLSCWYLAGVTMLYMAEFVLPASRAVYADVIWLPILAFGFCDLRLRQLVTHPAIVVLGVALAMAWGLPVLAEATYYAEWAMMFFALLVLTLKRGSIEGSINTAEPGRTGENALPHPEAGNTVCHTSAE